MTETARACYQRGDFDRARALCDQILARVPEHVASLNLIGLMAQATGRHQVATKMFTRALAANEFDTACHYNIACSYLALDRRDDATAHFRKAMRLGMNDENVEAFILQSKNLSDCFDRIRRKWPLPLSADELAGPAGMAAIADDVFLRCALECTIIRGVPAELLLTYLRSALLQLTANDAPDFAGLAPATIALFAAIARQCFINEYVYAVGSDEAARAARLRDLLNEKLAAGETAPHALLVAVASYYPLHTLTNSRALLEVDWPETLADLLRQQLLEPLEEAEERKTIPALTAVDDEVSLAVMHQYEENPYPRWTINPLTLLKGASAPHNDADGDPMVRDILIAGCGTGYHAIQAAQRYPAAKILAIDISRTSLAYARRMTREAGLFNIEYAQADILKLGSLGRNFDRIEASGVLHHLADPAAGWEVLLSLLRPAGEMRVALYSQIARKVIVDMRALMATRGYRPTPDGIRACRHEIIRNVGDFRSNQITKISDFYSLSGCRDLLFNIMEHRFTIPQIEAFLDAHGLTFLGFDLDQDVIERFRAQHPDASLTDLNHWQLFEAANPATFISMYQFTVTR